MSTDILAFLLLVEIVTLLTLLLDYVCTAVLKQHKYGGQDRLCYTFPRQKRTTTAFATSNNQSKVIKMMPYT